MADPTIQTFCCRGDIPSVLDVLDTNTYNVVCIASSAVGVIGALYQILPRQQLTHTHRWISLSATRGRQIIVWLAIADLLASLGVLVRSALWLSNQRMIPYVNETSNTLFCALTSAWIQYFYMATWIWNLCYAIDMRYLLRDQLGYPIYYHMASWIVPAVLTSTGLSILYIPNADCHNFDSLSSSLTRVLPNYLATYLPIATVMVVNPILYSSSSKDMETVIHRSFGQVTNRERDIINAIRLKFFLINAAFYLCWVPNLINGILLWTLWFNLPIKIIMIVWYIMAVMNPLQALLNCIVYRRWTRGTEKITIPWKEIYDEAQHKLNALNSNVSKESSLKEDLPLLQSVPRNSINGYTSL